MTPRFPNWLLRMRLPAERIDVIGDLEEAFQRDVQSHGRYVASTRYWKDALAIAIRLPRELTQYSTSLDHESASSSPVRRLPLFSRSDLKLAVRRARRQPVMTLTSILALGVGIGLPTGGYSVFQQIMHSRLPFANGDRFVQINTRSAETGSAVSVVASQVREFRKSAPSFRYIGGLSVSPLNVVLGDGTVERVPGARLTPGLLAALPYAPIAGRMFSSDDGTPGSEPVVLIRERYWERNFARNPDAIGSRLNVAGTRHTIVGVLPDAAGFPDDGELWLPVDEETLGALDDLNPVAVRLIGVLAPNADIGQADMQMNQLARQQAASTAADSLRVAVRPFTELSFGPQLQELMVMTMLILTVVLLVIAANVANLVSVSTSRRSAELAVRTALGASRSRLVTQILAEVMFVGLLGAALGLTITGSILRFYNTILDEKPYWMHFSFNMQTVLAALLLMGLACLVMGLPPALRATNGNTGDKMKGAGRGGALGVGRVGGFMIAFEVALSVALLGTAVQFARAFDKFANPIPGIAEHRVVTAQIYAELPSLDDVGSRGAAAAVAGRDSTVALAAAIREHLRQQPWVENAAVATNVPRSLPRAQSVVVEKSKASVLASVAATSGEFLEVLGVRQSVGRFVVDSDMLPGAPLIAVVNEAFADANYGTRAIVGERIQLASDAEGEEVAPWREIVGVVPNIMDVTTPDQGAGIYTPLGASPLMSVAVRVRTNPLDHVNDLRAALFEVDPALNVSRVVPLNKVNIEDVQATQVMSSALAGIAVVTMLLALAGIYSIVSLAVTQRTREIGVRVALGADRRQIMTSILRRSGTLIFAGAVSGAVLGALMGSVRMFVFTIPDQSILLQPTMVLLVVVAGALACIVPTRRALGIEPVEALRYEE